MNLFKPILFIAFFIFGFLIFPVKLIAQPDPCEDPQSLNCSCPEMQNDPACPIDGGVVALLAAGVGYGIKKARDSRKRIDNQSEPL